MNLEIVDLKSLGNQHPIYLLLLLIFIFLSQFLNIIFVTAPIFLYADFYDTLYNANVVFAKMSNYPDIFKPFIVMFLSRELSVSENEMIDNFDFNHQSEKLYFWVDKTDTNLSRYNHISR